MTLPTTVAVVPLRGPGGKTRLEADLDADAREELVIALARRVLDALTSAPEVAGVVVVTTDPEHASAVVGDRDVEVLPQPSEVRGLNPAVALGRARARARGADRTLVVHADLPLLAAADVAALAVPVAAVVIAPDVAGTGTNALVLDERRADGFASCFGPGSRHLHEAEARRLDLDVLVVERRGTAHDLDTPADWDALTEPERAALTRSRPLRR
ncbi:2-phospho-L-lactate guanylyltransferase [Actinotalea sp. Marseille-Q4924]|uniref:2-phospho-L-lactate guanylyltransferase n=1 Tax=Actinotalea sp. Marseille-Q4924 TaxID=2866571 RepID=UPI001CE45D6E|nr:2-phospho-L-lactate guanylyltransferase [Actinotalea sp. Marseille-Q4924]